MVLLMWVVIFGVICLSRDIPHIAPSNPFSLAIELIRRGQLSGFLADPPPARSPES